MQANWIYRFSLSRFYFLEEILNKSNPGAWGPIPVPRGSRGSGGRRGSRGQWSVVWSRRGETFQDKIRQWRLATLRETGEGWDLHNVEWVIVICGEWCNSIILNVWRYHDLQHSLSFFMHIDIANYYFFYLYLMYTDFLCLDKFPKSYLDTSMY